jgi:AraC-like DNA-binding protein
MCQLLEKPKASNMTIGNQFVRSFYRHLIENYGVQSVTAFEFSGGLSPRHKRIVEDAFSDPLCNDITIESLAGRCGLSAGHFARVFRQTFKRPFHQHLMKTRVQRAKELLRHSDLPLAEIAQAIGYADQATFTESFTRSTQVSPGRFRRQYRTSPIPGATSAKPGDGLSEHQSKPYRDRKTQSAYSSRANQITI